MRRRWRQAAPARARRGFRAAYSADFYVGYLRDPQGNKIALFSSNPEEPGRDG